MQTHSTLAAKPSNDDISWQAVVAKDAAFDGKFYYAVATTGVYCRPSCAARLPKRGNVSFYATREAAERAGFRACKRCKPDQPGLHQRQAQMVAQACRLIETSEDEPKLGDLAAAMGLSPYHFHRIFKETAGVTPKAYAKAHRNKRVRAELGRAGTVTAAIYASGFNSNGRFYANSTELLGMTPSDFRAGGTGQDVRVAIGECSLGLVLIAATGKGVCAILLGDDAEMLMRELREMFPAASLSNGDEAFEGLVAKVVAFADKPGSELDLPLDVQGTAFQHRVWDALRRIPAGTTATYTEIAQAIGAPKAVRAVARACATNKISLAIPCHRVVRSDGSLAGYRWGVERKRMLIAKERKE